MIRSPSMCRGITLVEVSVVLLILGILASGMLPVLAERESLRRVQETRSLLHSVRASLIGYYLLHGDWPCQPNCADVGQPVPAALAPAGGAIDASGQVIDAWHRPLRYTIAIEDADIRLCRRVGRRGCTEAHVLADGLRLLLLSQGADASAAGEQWANQDGDRIYLHRPYSQVPEQAYDDLLVWVSEAELAYWQARVGSSPVGVGH